MTSLFPAKILTMLFDCVYSLRFSQSMNFAMERPILPGGVRNRADCAEYHVISAEQSMRKLNRRVSTHRHTIMWTVGFLYMIL